jgi:peptidoglycan/LPS O-acetylase OafA/YrhL
MYSESKRVEYLDSIRGLAALFVLLSHSVGAFDWPAVYSTVLHLPFVSILVDGKEAVCMFFVLSGYVLSKPYAPNAGNSQPREIFLPTFYLRRFTRIWLPWFFFFLASMLARKYLFYRPATQPPTTGWLNGFWQADLTTGDFFRQCVFMLHDNSRLLLNQDWSLGVELKGSVLIPLFVFLLRRRWLPVLFGLAVAFVVFVGTGHYYVSFIMGALLAWYGQPLGSRLSLAPARTRFLVLILGLLFYQTFSALSVYFNGAWTAYKYGWLLSSIGCVLILLSVFASRTLQTWLNHGVFTFLGRISYSVYLLQFVVILCLLPPLVQWLNGLGVVNRPVLFASSILASMAVTIAGAALTYRAVEVPAINLGHRLTKGIQQRFQK